MRSPRTAWKSSAHRSLQLEKAHTQQQRPSEAKKEKRKTKRTGGRKRDKEQGQQIENSNKYGRC